MQSGNNLGGAPRQRESKSKGPEVGLFSRYPGEGGRCGHRVLSQRRGETQDGAGERGGDRAGQVLVDQVRFGFDSKSCGKPRRVYTEKRHDLIYIFKRSPWLLWGEWTSADSMSSDPTLGREPMLSQRPREAAPHLLSPQARSCVWHRSLLGRHGTGCSHRPSPDPGISISSL